jgi:hypothetical protein
VRPGGRQFIAALARVFPSGVAERSRKVRDHQPDLSPNLARTSRRSLDRVADGSVSCKTIIVARMHLLSCSSAVGSEL